MRCNYGDPERHLLEEKCIAKKVIFKAMVSICENGGDELENGGDDGKKCGQSLQNVLEPCYLNEKKSFQNHKMRLAKMVGWVL